MLPDNQILLNKTKLCQYSSCFELGEKVNERELRLSADIWFNCFYSLRHLTTMSQDFGLAIVCVY